MLSLGSQQKNLCIWARTNKNQPLHTTENTFFFSKGQVMDLSSRASTYLCSTSLRLQRPFEISGSSTLEGEASIQGGKFISFRIEAASPPPERAFLSLIFIRIIALTQTSIGIFLFVFQMQGICLAF